MNVGLNWIFIYGHLGFRRTGRHRCGARHPRIAYRHADHDYRLFLQKTEIPRLSSGILAPQLFGQNDPHIAAYGPSDLPADVSEASAFVGTSIMMGWLSKTAISANQIAMTLGNCAFMIVTSIGAATTIRISHCYGARSVKELTLAAKASLPPGHRLEPLRRHHVHLALQRHPDFLHHQRRSDRPGLEADPC